METGNMLHLDTSQNDIRDFIELTVSERGDNEEILSENPVSESDNYDEDPCNDEHVSVPTREFTVDGIRKAFSLIAEGMKTFENEDSNLEKFVGVSREITKCLQMYKSIYNMKKKVF